MRYLIKYLNHQKFVFLHIYKMYPISAERYTNAGVHFLKIRETGEIWPSMKNSGKGLGVLKMN